MLESALAKDFLLSYLHICFVSGCRRLIAVRNAREDIACCPRRTPRWAEFPNNAHRRLAVRETASFEQNYRSQVCLLQNVYRTNCESTFLINKFFANMQLHWHHSGSSSSSDFVPRVTRLTSNARDVRLGVSTLPQNEPLRLAAKTGFTISRVFYYRRFFFCSSRRERRIATIEV